MLEVIEQFYSPTI